MCPPTPTPVSPCVCPLYSPLYSPQHPCASPLHAPRCPHVSPHAYPAVPTCPLIHTLVSPTTTTPVSPLYTPHCPHTSPHTHPAVPMCPSTAPPTIPRCPLYASWCPQVSLYAPPCPPHPQSNIPQPPAAPPRRCPHLLGTSLVELHPLVPLVDVVGVLAQQDAVEQQRAPGHQLLEAGQPQFQLHLLWGRRWGHGHQGTRGDGVNGTRKGWGGGVGDTRDDRDPPQGAG